MIDTNEYIDELMIEVDKAVAENEPRVAKNLLEQVLTVEPSYSIAHNYLGWLYMYAFRNYHMAESHLRMAIKFKPAHPPAFQHLGTLMVLTKKYEVGEQILRQGLHYEGIDAAPVYEGLGKIYEIRGKYFLARKYYKLAVKNCFDNEHLDSLQKDLKRCRIKLFLF